MPATTVVTSGPLFEGRIDVKAGLRVGVERVAVAGAQLVRQQLSQRSRYRTPKYGHVVDAVRTQVKVLPRGDVGARIYLGGPSAYLGAILEGGTRAHPIPRVRILGAGSRRRLSRGRKPLVFRVGGRLIIRQFADHPGTPAYHWRLRAKAALDPRVQPIVDQAMAEALRG